MLQEHYKRAIAEKIEQLTERRKLMIPSLQRQLEMQAQQQARQAHANQQMMFNQNGMQGQIPQQQQQPQQGFGHLQHQMQASPIPGQNQMPMGMPNNGLPPNMAPNQQQQQFMLQQQQQQQQRQAQLQNGAARPQEQLSPHEHQMINTMAQRMLGAATEEDKQEARRRMDGSINPAVLANYRARGMDPLSMWYRNQAMIRFRANKANNMAQQQQQFNNTPQQQPPNMAPSQPMQQQRSLNPSPMNGQLQPPATNGGNQEFFVAGNMGNMDQQQQGFAGQDGAQMQIPPRGNTTPQPGSMNPQQMNMNANPNGRATQQQQFMNAQQTQQQRMQLHAARQQQQTQAARTQAAAKAQMGLQGQPGGMGTGPMPPQPSPAMATLNAPLRAQAQQLNPSEPPPANPNAQFGQSLDPRFMQRGATNPIQTAMMATMNQQQIDTLSQLPREKLDDVVRKWHMAQTQRANVANGQAGRPQGQMPMQINGQMRPGQMPNSGPISNQQVALQQWWMNHPGQPPPPQLTNGLSQQQQMNLRQQMAQRQQQSQNPLQQGNVTPNLAHMSEQSIAQMDNMEFPLALLKHQLMPRQIPVPPEITRWGFLKRWAHNQPSYGPEEFAAIDQLQKVHFTGLLANRARQQQAAQQQALQQQQGQPGQNQLQSGMPQGMMGMQNNSGQMRPGGPMPPGSGMPAPVAPMGQGGQPPNLLQMQNGIPMNLPPGRLPQISPADIQNARQQLPQFAQLSDDQIRQMLIKRHSYIGSQQQEHAKRQAIMQQMQMANMNGQQLPNGMTPGNNSLGLAQNMPPRNPQPKQPQTAPEPVPTPGPAQKSNKVTPAGRAAQNSSPAPLNKNLKRASSDDVVEVPNPNTQPPRGTPQQTHTQKPILSTRQSLTPEQIAQLNPEQRKKYEHSMRMAQQSLQAQNPNTETIAKLKAIQSEAASSLANKVFPTISMDDAEMTKMRNLLKAIQNPLRGLGKAIIKWYHLKPDDNKAKLFFLAVSSSFDYFLLFY